METERKEVSFLLPFLIGALVGGFGGAIFGTLLSPYFVMAKSAVGRAIRRGSSDQPKFELLLQ